MKVIISGKNVDLTDAVKKRVEDKLSKLDKFFTSETTATVTLKKEKIGDIAEINIPVRGNLLRVLLGRFLGRCPQAAERRRPV